MNAAVRVGTKRRGRRIAAIVVALLVVVAVAAAARTRAVEHEVSVQHVVNGSGSLRAIDMCARFSVTATVAGRTAASGPRLLGWSDAAILDPDVAVSVAPCSGRDAVAISRLTFRVSYQEASCRMRPVNPDGDEEDRSSDELDDPEDTDDIGYRVQTGAEPCGGESLIVSSTFDDTPEAKVYSNDRLLFAGRTWSRDLCFTVGVTVEVVAGATVTTADLRSARQLCVS